jgi:hypothetical protein
MNDNNTLLALAQRCEDAEGPDRELDTAVFAHLRPDLRIADKADLDRFPGDPIRFTNGFLLFKVPLFTASLDAALTLVPEGMIWMLTNSGTDHPTAPDFTKATAIVGDWRDTQLGLNVAATPALALCAAALKARAAQGDVS